MASKSQSGAGWYSASTPSKRYAFSFLLKNCSVVKKGAITSKIKQAIKRKTSPARLARLLQPSLALCFRLQPMTAYRPGLDGVPSRTGRYAVIGCKLKQNANEGCNNCATVVQVLQDLFYVLLHVLFYLWSLLKSEIDSLFIMAWS